MEQILNQISPIIRELLNVAELSLAPMQGLALQKDKVKETAFELSLTSLELYMTESIRKKINLTEALNVEKQWLRESLLKNLMRLLKSKEVEKAGLKPSQAALLYLYFKVRLPFSVLERIFDCSHLEFIQEFFFGLELMPFLPAEDMHKIFNYRCPVTHKVMSLNWWPLQDSEVDAQKLSMHKKNCRPCREMEEEAMLLNSLLLQYFNQCLATLGKPDVEGIQKHLQVNYLEKKSVMAGIGKWFDQTF